MHTLREINPEASKMWCYELNIGITPDTISGYSEKEAYFRCLENPKHLFKKRISKMTSHRDGHNVGCLYCGPNAKVAFPGETDLITVVSDAAAMWDYDKNTLDPTNILPKSSKYAYFKCDKGHSVSRKICDFTRSSQCPKCTKSNTLIVTNSSYIKKFWDFVKNKELELNTIIQSSSQMAWFKCPKCDYEWKSSIKHWNRIQYCKCCGFDGEKFRTIEEKIQTLKMAHPNIIDSWDYKKNGNITPDSLTAKSSYRAYFKCEHGHSYKKIASSMANCPICIKIKRNESNDKKQIDIKERSLAVKRPDMLKFWDFDKNEINPEEISPWSKETAFWKCNNCGYEWEQKICNRADSKKGKCPSCDMKRLFSSAQINPKGTFRQYNPKAAMQWVDDMNDGITPDNIAKKSAKSIFMRCINNPEHIYSIEICKIPLEEPYGCPLCRKHRMIIPGINDLFTTNKTVKDMWNYEENKGFDLDKIHPGSDTKASWICKKGHIFYRKIAAFVKNPTCPMCKKENNSVACFSHLTKQWDFKKNKGIDINLVSVNSNKVVWWKCKKCNYEWQTKISSRKNGKGLCPCCELRTVVIDGITDLFTMIPDVKTTYDFEKNIDIVQSKLSVSSCESVWWKCNICDYSWKTTVKSRISFKNGKYSLRKCPVCTGNKRVISYAEEYPDLKERFLEEFNHCTLNDLTSADLRKNFWWHCNLCEENFKCSLGSIIRSRETAFKGCSYCSGKSVLREKSFAALHPELMDEYDSENIIDPFTVSEFSGKIVKWRCRNNKNHSWETNFGSRANGIGGCKICRGYNYGKMFYEEHTEFEQFYDLKKNERPFNSYSNASNEVVWWRCSNNHSFQWPIIYFSRTNRFSCPICDNRQLAQGINDLETCDRELSQEYNISKNNTTPNNVLITNNNSKTWWKCKEGHEFQRSVWYRVNTTRECPICTRRTVIKGINDFQTKYSRIVDIWDFDRNDRNPDEISDISHEKYSFKCEFGHRYERNLNTVIYNDFECPVCNGKIVQVGVNSLLDTHKELSLELSPNEKHKPSEVHKSYAYNALWRCKVCNGDYLYPIRDREVGDNSCPYCNERKVMQGFNSLIDTDFELSKEWSSNNGRQPTEFMKNSAFNALWNCPTCRGEYAYPIRDRYIGDKSCPFCNNKKALPGYNTLKVKYPKLMGEWYYRNNYLLVDPDAILPTYAGDVWWECSRCREHYKMSPKRRLYFQMRKMESCIFCKGRRRKRHRHF